MDHSGKVHWQLCIRKHYCWLQWHFKTLDRNPYYSESRFSRDQHLAFNYSFSLERVRLISSICLGCPLKTLLVVDIHICFVCMHLFLQELQGGKLVLLLNKGSQRSSFSCIKGPGSSHIFGQDGEKIYCQVPPKQFFFVYPHCFQIISKDWSTCVLFHQCFIYSISLRPGSTERDLVFCDQFSFQSFLLKENRLQCQMTFSWGLTSKSHTMNRKWLYWCTLW